MKLRKMWVSRYFDDYRDNMWPYTIYASKQDQASISVYLIPKEELKELARYFWGEGYRFCGFIPESESTEFEQDFMNFMEAQDDKKE